MTTALILASSRSTGNTKTLVDFAFPNGVDLFVDLQTLRIGYYSYENDYKDDDFLSVIHKLMPHDTWVIATPLYWYSMSAHAKTFLDRLTDLLDVHKELGRQLRGKHLAVLCSGKDPTPPSSFDDPFRLTCEHLGIKFLGTRYMQFHDEQSVDVYSGHETEPDDQVYIAQLTPEDKAALTRLEEAMWQVDTRFDLAFQASHFAADFVEFGRSGRVYNKADVMRVEKNPINATLPLPDLRIRQIDQSTALGTV